MKYEIIEKNANYSLTEEVKFGQPLAQQITLMLIMLPE